MAWDLVKDKFRGYTVRIEAFPIPDSNIVRLLAVSPAIDGGPFMTVEECQVRCSFRAELDAAFVGFCKEVMKKFPGARIDTSMPNLYSAFTHSRIVPKPDTLPPPVLVPGTIPGTHWAKNVNPFKDYVLPVETFEVNMMEALVGWKSWITQGGYLTTRGGFVWFPEKATEAKCEGGRHSFFSPPLRHEKSLRVEDLACQEIPNLEHSCGIYAADEPDRALEFYGSRSNVFGQVYGWGRYVRGNNGWRSQFAYPKSFIINEEQMPLMEVLRKYHVPIYVRTQTLLFNPEEDGYGYRENQENGDRGTDQESYPPEGDFAG